MEGDYIEWMQKSSGDFSHVAGSSTVVEIRTQEKDGNFLKGSYTRLGITRESKFLRYPSDQEKLCLQIVTSAACSSSILSPVVFCRSLDSQWIYMGYNFEKANVRDNSPVFARHNGIMREKWRTQIRDLLITFSNMHNDGVIHGELENINNYVYRHGRIRIVGPTQDVNGKTEAQIAVLKESDIRGFRLFLNQVLFIAPGCESDDLNLFYDLMTTPRVNDKIQCLINHPVLKNEDGRLMYFWHWYDCWMSTSSVPTTEVRKFERILSKELSCFQNWDSFLDPFYKQRYTKPASNKPYKKVHRYNGTDILDFPRFVRNESKHLVLDNLKTSIEIERDLQRMYPGLISRLHNCVAELNCSHYGIARLHRV